MSSSTLQTRCISESSLQTLLVGAMHEEQEQACATHLDECNSCQQRLERLAGPIESELSLQAHCDSPSSQLPTEYMTSLYNIMHQSSTEAMEDDSFLANQPLLDLLDSSEDGPYIGRFSDYNVVELIGRGGMGIVFKVFDPNLQRFDALKLLAPHLAASESARKRFLAEARAMARIDDRYVLSVHKVGQHRGLPFIVMPLVDGISLEQELNRCGKLSVERSLAVTRQVCQALVAAHASGIIHRDIKPANVLLQRSTGVAKVTDFGLARTVEGQSLTYSGFVNGTPQYMSPEQVKGESVDERTDLYSLGAVLYRMLSGKSLVDCSNPISALHKVVHGQPDSLQHIAADVPRWLCELVDNLIAKDREDRIASAEELLVRLETGYVSPPDREAKSLARSISLNEANERDKILSCVPTTAHDCKRQAGRRSTLLIAAAIFAVVAFLINSLFSPRVQHNLVSESTPPTCTLRTPNGEFVQYDNLVEAIQSATSGGRIIVRGPGPFRASAPLTSDGISVVSTYPSGTQLILEHTNASDDNAAEALWNFGGNSELSGLRITSDSKSAEESGAALLAANSGELRIENCSLARTHACLRLKDTVICTLEGTLVFSRSSDAIELPMSAGVRMVCTDCLITGNSAFSLSADTQWLGGDMTLRGCTLYADKCFAVDVLGAKGMRDSAFNVEARRNIFQARFLHAVDGVLAENVALLERRSRLQFEQRVCWRGDQNLYSIGEAYCGFKLFGRGYVGGRGGPRKLNQWRTMCTQEGDASIEAPATVLRVTKLPTRLDWTRIDLLDFLPDDDQRYKSIGVGMSTLANFD